MAFIDTRERPAGEVQQKVGRLKLSEAIRRGAEQTAATKDIGIKAWVTWRRGGCFSCVIGAAWIGFNGLDQQKYYHEGSIIKSVMRLAGISYEEYSGLQHAYEHGGLSREEIADMLAAQGL